MIDYLMKKIFVLPFLLILTASCANKEPWSLSTSNSTLYIIESSAGVPQTDGEFPLPCNERLKPYLGTLSFMFISDGIYDIIVRYVFDYGDDHQRVFSFTVENVPISQENKYFSINALGCYGKGMIENTSFEFDNINVCGTIETPDNTSISFTGQANGSAFNLVISSLAEKPNSATSYTSAYADIEWLFCYYLSFMNNTDGDCRLTLFFNDNDIITANLAPKASFDTHKYLVDFLGACCTGVEIVYSDGKVVSLPGESLVLSNIEDNTGLYMTNTEDLWYFSVVDATIEQVPYTRKIFSIVYPNI